MNNVNLKVFLVLYLKKEEEEKKIPTPIDKVK
jgi:hypothetical protein